MHVPSMTIGAVLNHKSTTVAAKPTPEQLATRFTTACREHGFSFSVNERGTIVTIEKRFTPGDKSAYCEADSVAYSILSLIPLSAVWWLDMGHRLRFGRWSLRMRGRLLPDEQVGQGWQAVLRPTQPDARRQLPLDLIVNSVRFQFGSTSHGRLIVSRPFLFQNGSFNHG